jgi:hypothetical protein
MRGCFGLASPAEKPIALDAEVNVLRLFSKPQRFVF